jgi:hypothetical protein
MSYMINIDHRLQLWDSLIMAVAAEKHCRIILTEDLQNGFIWRGLTVINPFSEPLHPLLKNILANHSINTDRETAAPLRSAAFPSRLC